jgi:hypothetical protein
MVAQAVQAAERGVDVIKQVPAPKTGSLDVEPRPWPIETLTNGVWGRSRL